MREEQAKHILQTVYSGDHFYLRHYNMNLYRGCCHGCIYCDSRSDCYQIERFSSVRAKKDALLILREELKVKRTPGIVGFGATSDSYNPFEKKTRLTAGALELLSQYGFGVGITTKSDLVARDIPLLQAIMRYAPAHVTFSITSSDPVVTKKIEPHAPTTDQRFAAMSALSAAGILSGVWINPVLPFITDTWETLRTLLHRTREAGGQYAVCFFGMTLRDGSREYYYSALDQHFPGLKRKYAEHFGLKYECPSPDAERLYALYRAECEALGLKTTFSEINALIVASGGATQLSFI